MCGRYIIRQHGSLVARPALPAARESRCLARRNARGNPRGAQPYPSELMVAYEASTRVNSVKNDSPELIVPVDGSELPGATRDL